MSTRERLLASATKLMLLKGYNSTSVDEICAGAGATKGAFFHHFATKDEAALEALDRYAARIFQVMDEGRAGKSCPMERLMSYLEGLARIAEVADREPACLLGMQIMERGATDAGVQKACARHFGAWRREIVALVEAAKGIGSQSSIDPEAVADQLIALFEGSLLLARAQGDAGVVFRNVSAFRDQVRQMLAP